jgi:hypothetical protein
MYRRSTNNPWIPVGGINSGYFGTIGGADAGSLDNRFPGQLGQTVVHSNKSALQDSKTSVGTLFQGVYQLVKFNSAVTRGHMLCWETNANNGIPNFLVTGTVTTVSLFRAGVCLFTDAQATGKFGYIQVAGLASQLAGTIAGGVIGQLLVQEALNTNVFTNLTDATQFPAATQASDFKRGPIGLAYELPVTGTVTKVLMNPWAYYPNVG